MRSWENAQYASSVLNAYLDCKPHMMYLHVLIYITVIYFRYMCGIREPRHQLSTSMAKNSLSREENLQIPKLKRNLASCSILNLLNLWHTLFCHYRHLNGKSVYKLNQSVTLEYSFGLERAATSRRGGGTTKTEFDYEIVWHPRPSSSQPRLTLSRMPYSSTF